MRDNLIKKRTITRIGPEGRRQVEDELLWEDCWMLYCDTRPVFEHHCLSVSIEQMAVGQLRYQGLIESYEDIDSLEVDEGAKSIFAKLKQTAPEKKPGSKPAESVFETKDIHRLQYEFNTRCGLFRRTGSAHCCALADKAGVIVFFEDVARHNAMDKLLGEFLIKHMDAQDKALYFSGRLALDMVEKAIATGVKVLVSPGAPTLAAVEAAEKHDLTMLGFVREDNINVYCGGHRIVQAQ